MLAWLPENISTFGGDLDDVFALIYYIVGIWFVLTQALIIILLIRYRRKEGKKAVYVHGNNWSQALWILIPCVLVLTLDMWIEVRGSNVWAHIKLSQPKPDVTVKVTGKQFNWIITYPGPDGKFGTADDRKLDNDIHVPVGKVVRIILESKDVIHSFFVPALRLKQDAVPGRRILAWFQATKTGKWEIPCAELCGFGHSGMKGLLTVHSADDYRAWRLKQWPSSG